MTVMKKLFSLLCTLMCAGQLLAYDFEVNGIYYKKLGGDSVEVTYKTYRNSSYSGSVTIPEAVTYSSSTYRVTSIGSYAFYNCRGLTSVTIPNSVTTIGDYAFEYCYGLKTVTIPNSVTTIGSFAFEDCSGLTKTNYTGTIADWCKIKFGSYGANPMYYSHNFYINDVEVKDLAIPEGVKAIGSNAFRSCSGLTSVTIPNSVTTIGSYAFSGCSGLTSVTIPNSVTTIGVEAFYGCSGLTSPVYNSNCFAYMPTSYKGTYNIPDGIKQIAGGAFEGCSGLTSVTIPNSVTTIGDDAFYGCSGLTSVTIPNSVTTIGSLAFYNCSRLISITIPNSVTTIGGSAFKGCSGLTSITCYATNPPTCGVSCFYEVDKTIPVYVPARSVDAYKQANEWKDFKNIQGFPNDYAIVTCSATNGTIKGDGKYIKGDTCTLTVTPSYGYKFTQWTDSVTDNPRSFVVTQDTSFMAEFAKNQYLISVGAEHGVVSGGGYYEYQSDAQLTATADEHYHFVKWSDGNTSNPRTISVTGNKTYTAIFALDQFTISATATHGAVTGTGKYDYGKEITLTVIPDTGYQFTQWNDGNTDNPRSFVVTQDTTFIAQIDTARSGQCGDDLTWRYNDGVLVISGTGAMYDYTQDTAPWMLFFQESISSLVINNGCTSIGDFAFYGLSNKNFKTIDIPNGVEQIGQFAFANCNYLKTLYLGPSIEEISDSAFANDERLLYITCYAIEPPLLEESAFANYDVYLSVPCESQDEYKVSKGWKLFNKENVSCIGAEEKPITGDEVTVNPSADNATFTWPQNDHAAGYSIEITKDGIVFCTLTFNAQGQLTGIAFAPNRAGSRMLDAAVMTSNGWQFTVTGLDQASKYGYALDALNASKQSIKHYEGEFATDGYTSLEWVTSDKIQGINKMLLDGHLYILRDGNLYTATGARVK